MPARDGGTHGAIVITGASTGIGRACALHLDRLGYRVFAGVRREVDGESLAAATSDRLRWVLLDVTNRDQIAGAQREVEAAIGDAGLAGLINNAGIVVAAPTEVVPIDGLRRQLEVNTIGAIAVTQAFLPMLRAARGRIINVSSISGRIAFPILGPYAASKFALGALSDALRVELHGSGVTVTCIEPGSVVTPIWDKSIASVQTMMEGIPPERLDRYEPMMQAARESALSKNERGMPVERVVEAVMRALTARRPKAHHIIGGSSRRMYWLTKFMPWSVRDRLFAWGMQRLVQRTGRAQRGTGSRR
jgi:NAD(P)-dependent dehydrogenase (short-subunit alcohol dehydrogenase family)